MRVEVGNSWEAAQSPDLEWTVTLAEERDSKASCPSAMGSDFQVLEGEEEAWKWPGTFGAM